MPEILEVERYRRLAERVVGRTISSVDAGDAWFLKGGLTAAQARTALLGGTVVAARRRGKLLLLDLAGRPTLGIRFGMTGRLVVDGMAGVDGLEYGPSELGQQWDRFGLGFGPRARGGSLRVNDPRRLGGVVLDPDEDELGPDALTATRAQLGAALAGSEVALKARLLDQAHLAGVGNLLADETLWRAGLDPARPAGSLGPAELAGLHRALRTTLRVLDQRGGSHTGDLQAERSRSGTCPKDGAPLQRRTIGGRTTYSCPAHQR